jgi:hypothetical protein
MAVGLLSFGEGFTRCHTRYTDLLPVANNLQKELSHMLVGRSMNRYVKPIVIAVFLFSCSASLHAQEKPAIDCTPAFPFKDSWWGADAAYSIPLPDGRAVWIFGDTLYGDRRVVEGNEPRMVRNSIGISTCNDRGWKVDYVIRKNDKGQPLDFFQAQHQNTWYWALDGFLYKNGLWVTLLCMRDAPKSTPTALGFETCGADLAKISGLENDPQRWSVKYFPLVPDGVHAYPSATAVVEGEYAYIFALLETGSRPMLLTRIPLGGLDAPAEHLQYLARSGVWKRGLKPADAMHVMPHGNTEMTVRYHPSLRRWIAVLNYPKLFSDKIIALTAPQLAGPWSEGKVIYHIPEMQKGWTGYDKDTICYAGKEHPEFRRPGSVLITYACNTMAVQKLVGHLDIYFPKVVRVPFK